MTLRGKMETNKVANFDQKKGVLFFSNGSDEVFAFTRFFTVQFTKQLE